MLSVFVGAVGTAFGVLFIAAAVALFRPYGLFATRLRAGAAAFLALIVIGGLANVTPERPTDISPTEWTRRLGICREAGEQPSCALKAGDVTAAQAKVRPSPAASTAAAAGPDSGLPPTAEAEAEVTAKVRELDRIGGPCDRAVQTASSLRDRYAGYRAAKKAQDACVKAGIDMSGIKFGEPLSADAQSDLNAAIHCFGLTYVGRGNAMRDAAKIMDGDDRPSSVSAFREEMSEALANGSACGVRLAEAGAKHGLISVMNRASKTARGKT